jgi:hypothetical protein
MKIKDLELSQYSYKRISLALKSGPIFFPPEYEEVFKTLYGEEEIDEANIECTENGWLLLRSAQTEN